MRCGLKAWASDVNVAGKENVTILLSAAETVSKI